MHMQSQQATSTTGSRAVPMEESGNSGVTQNLGLLSGRPSPAPSLEDHQDVVTSSESEPDGCPSDDTDISSEEERPVGQFASRREFLCFGYLFGRARVTLRQYDIMREAENSFSPKEKWPSRWRLQQLRKQMLNTAIPLRREVTTRQLPVGKGKALRKLPDVTVSYIPFSVHIKRDFEDPVTAALFHSEGDARAGTVERPTEFFQTVAARDPARFNFKNGFFRDGYTYGIGCIVSVFLDGSTTLPARLESTAIASDGDVSISEASYAPPSALRVGDLLGLFDVMHGIEPPDPWASCFKDARRCTLRFTRSGGVFINAVRSSTEREKDSWTLLTAEKPIELTQVAEQNEDELPEKDPHTLYVSLYADEFSVYKRRRGSLEGYYGAYTSLSLHDRAFSVRPLFYLPPGANPEALLKRVVEDMLQMSKEGVAVYDAHSKENVVVRVFLSLGVFDFPMAAKFSNSVGAPGTEHCTSCDIVHPKTKSERRDRAMSSTVSFDVKDTRYSRVQERTAAIMSSLKRSTQLSAEAMKDALLLNGVTDMSGSLMMRLTEARGPGTFDIHEHVIVAPSHLLYYNIASNLLMEAYEALSVGQRDKFISEMRRSSKHVPTHTILSSFEPEKMGGTTLSMSDYAVLLTVGPTVLEYSVHTSSTSAHAVATVTALKALRHFATALFYRPTLCSDGEHAVRERPTVVELQRLGESLMIELRRLLPFSGKWERPAVHRLLELLYRTLPLVQLGSSICELIFENFHQMAKREIGQSNHRNPAEYSMQRWRDTEQYSRALSMPDEYGIPKSWLLGLGGNPLKAVSFHRLAPQKRLASATGERWCGREALSMVLGSTEDFWRGHTPNAPVKFWRKARHPQRSFFIREGSTVSVLQEEDACDVLNDPSTTGGQRVQFGRVRAIGTIAEELYLECEWWTAPASALCIVGKPTVVQLDATSGVELVQAERVLQSAFVLPCGADKVLFTKKSGFHFKSG